MTRLDHGLAGPRSRCSGIARAKSAPGLRAQPDTVGAQGPSPSADERWVQGPSRIGDHPAPATEPGITSGASVADGLKPAGIRARPRPSNLDSAPAVRSLMG